MKKVFIFFTLLLYSSFVLYSQNRDSIDNTALLLGMIDYPRIKLDILPYDALLFRFSESKDADFCIETLKKIDTCQFSSLEIERKTGILKVEGDSVLNYLDSYLIFVPYKRKDLKEEFKDKKVVEGYINPYKLSLKQQESFLLGFIIAKAKKNNDFAKEFYHMGDYNVSISKSKMFYEIIISFMNNSNFEIVSRTIKQYHYEYGFEQFFGVLSFNIPEKFQRYIIDREVNFEDGNN